MKEPNRNDVIVGANIRRARQLRLMSQEALANELDVTFQQVQKYEKGTNRVSASRLIAIAAALKCSLADLFTDTGVFFDDGPQLPALNARTLRIADMIDKLEPTDRDAVTRLVMTLSSKNATEKAA